MSNVTETDFPYRFSVIIPMEFHRGQIEKCMRGWVKEQNYPQSHYEILAVVCPASMDENMISIIKAELRPQDRLILHNDPHDISLCAYGAHEAKGEFLIFTESHCLPDINVLSLSEQKMQDHPEWAGFSGNSLPITPNRLSIIEAEMYDADIKYGMTEHPWRKILDQFFVVRKREYHECGGFIPQLGHFAEWHLAAHMHQKEYLIGYAPDVQFWHYYAGDYRELIEFTEDFVRGEMKYKSEFTGDTCQKYFPASNEWQTRHNWLPRFAKQAIRLSWRAYPKSISRYTILDLIAQIQLIIHLYMRALFGIKLSTLQNQSRYIMHLFLMRFVIFFNLGRQLLGKTFLHVIDSTIRLERIRFIKQWLKTSESHGKGEQPFTPSIIWNPEIRLDAFIALGLHPPEEWEGILFRWTEPVAIMELPLQSGSYDFTVEWMTNRKITNFIAYVNEIPLKISKTRNKATGKFTVNTDQPTVFSITCEAWGQPRNDPRFLGMPIKSISWVREQ